MSMNTMVYDEKISAAFRAMNTDVRAVVVAHDVAEVETTLSDVESLFEEVEDKLSRFKSSSELSQLNRSAGKGFIASPLLFEVVSEAVSWAQATDGLFDPTVLIALMAVGYNRSFELLAYVEDKPTGAQAIPKVSWRDVTLDPLTSTISLPEGCGLDLGGIGKGWTVDRAVNLLRRFVNFAIDAGGDIYLGGTQVDGSPWTVGVEDPFEPGRNLAILALKNHAVATSTTMRRRWSNGGSEQHHLIDPRTGSPSDSDVVSVSVIADSVARAEVLAKVALLLGAEPGLRFLEEQENAEGLLVMDDGSIRYSAGFEEVVYAR